MKIKLFLVPMIFAALAVMTGCGQNVAPAGATLTVYPTSITLSDGIDPYVDQYIHTLVTNANGDPMNGIIVKYEGTFAVGDTANNTGIYAFLDSSGKVCPSPCSDTTNSSGVSIMTVRFCTTVACNAYVPLPSDLTSYPATTALTYTPGVTVASGQAAPIAITVKIN